MTHCNVNTTVSYCHCSTQLLQARASFSRLRAHTICPCAAAVLRDSLKISTLATASVTTIKGGKSVVNYIPVAPSTSYTISFWMKTTANSGSANTGAYVNPAQYNGSGTNVANDIYGSITSTTGWTQYSAAFTTLSTTQFIAIVASVTGTDGTGTLIMDAWFDDIVLMPTNNTTRGLAS